MLYTDLTTDVMKSLKAGNRMRVDTLRFLLSDIKNAAIAKYGAQADTKLTDTDILAVIKKQVKTHKESIEAYAKAGRKDLEDKEQTEYEILMAFLPKEMTDDAIGEIIDKTILLDSGSITGPEAFPLYMKKVMQAMAGRADGAKVAKLLREKLQKKG